MRDERGYDLRKQRGFTLLEALIVVAILSVMSAMGVTMYRGLVARASLDTFTNDFTNAVRLARTRAIGDMDAFMVCPSRDGEACTENAADFGNYEENKTGGILVLKRAVQPGDPANVIRYVDGTVKVKVANSTAGQTGGTVVYTRNGQPVSSFRGLKLTVGYYNQYNDETPTRAQVVCINRTGAVSVLAVAKADECVL